MDPGSNIIKVLGPSLRKEYKIISVDIALGSKYMNRKRSVQVRIPES